MWFRDEIRCTRLLSSGIQWLECAIDGDRHDAYRFGTEAQGFGKLKEAECALTTATYASTYAFLNPNSNPYEDRV